MGKQSLFFSSFHLPLFLKIRNSVHIHFHEVVSGGKMMGDWDGNGDDRWRVGENLGGVDGGR